MNGENRLLVTDELVEFGKKPVEVVEIRSLGNQTSLARFDVYPDDMKCFHNDVTRSDNRTPLFETHGFALKSALQLFLVCHLQIRVRETLELDQLKSAPSQLLPVFFRI